VTDELWQRVHENPDDEGVRQVLADALQERGDPRGRFIAIQLELHKVSADERNHTESELADEERVLLEAHAATWTQGWPFERRPEFIRGFPERQVTTARELHDEWWEARRLAPTLREAALVDDDPRAFSDDFRAMADVAEGLDRLTLPITFQPRDAEVFRQLSVRRLRFSGGTLGEGVRHLAHLPLEHLALDFDVALSNGTALAKLPLKSLLNSGNPLELQEWPQLEWLALDRVETRADPRRWPRLRRLELTGMELGRRGLRQLLGSGHPTVRRLKLSHERIESGELELLDRWPALEVLDLRGCAVNGDALQASPLVRRLRRCLSAG
jgi:uncharacterized protein (TIGR02996 family)